MMIAWSDPLSNFIPTAQATRYGANFIDIRPLQNLIHFLNQQTDTNFEEQVWPRLHHYLLIIDGPFELSFEDQQYFQRQTGFYQSLTYFIKLETFKDQTLADWWSKVSRCIYSSNSSR